MKRMVSGLKEANDWAQTADGAAVGRVFSDIGFALLKLLFAFTYLLLTLADILVGQVESLVSRKRGELGDRREKKLKTHLDWDKEAEADRPTGALRR